MSFFRKIVQQLIPTEVVPTDERREAVRLNFQTELELDIGGRRISASLLNLTFTGLCLSMYEELREGQKLTLHRDLIGPSFEGTVLWCKSRGDDFLVGIQCELDESSLLDSWLYQTLLEAGFEAEYVDERRTLIRVPGRIKCDLETSAGYIGSGTLLDLSTGGALLEWETELKPDTPVKLTTAALGEVPGVRGEGKIVSVRSEVSGEWLCGLFFEKIDKEATLRFIDAMTKV